ncbi:type II secretion system protein [bacterium]|nr:type II secretion system protein [bacterium]
MGKRGFTLAETLITLGIIGVVATMVIPTLHAHIRILKYATQLKKDIATLKQVAIGGLAMNGLSYRDAAEPCTADGANDTSDEVLTLCALFNDTLTASLYVEDASTLLTDKNIQYKVTKAAEGSGLDYLPEDGVPVGYHAYMLADGSMFVFPEDAANCTKEVSICQGWIDVNGSSMPNKEVSCDGGNANASDCSVSDNLNYLTDIYPVNFYDCTVEPSTKAGRYVLMASRYSNIDRSGKTNNSTETEPEPEGD